MVHLKPQKGTLSNDYLFSTLEKKDGNFIIKKDDITIIMLLKRHGAIEVK